MRLPNLQILIRGESIASLQQDVDSLRKEIALVASGEEEPPPGCGEEEDNVENSDGIRIHEKTRVVKNTATTTDIEKSSAKKRGMPHKNRSGKRVSR